MVAQTSASVSSVSFQLRSPIALQMNIIISWVCLVSGVTAALLQLATNISTDDICSYSKLIAIIARWAGNKYFAYRLPHSRHFQGCPWRTWWEMLGAQTGNQWTRPLQTTQWAPLMPSRCFCFITFLHCWPCSTTRPLQ